MRQDLILRDSEPKWSVERAPNGVVAIRSAGYTIAVPPNEIPVMISALQAAASGGADLFGAMVPAAKQAPCQIAGSFEAWWRQYPRKVGKGAARKAYERVVKAGKATPDDLLGGLARYHPDPKFTKHPATWLNAECWLDEPDKPTPPVRPGSAAMGILNVIAEREGL